jgi:transcriptional regulator with XRE-family HTH domain
MARSLRKHRKKTASDLGYGRFRTAEEIGELSRRERIRKELTLADVYETTGLSTRFLSEFERGKKHASIERVLRTLESLGLDVIILPRDQSERVLRDMARTLPPRRR